MIGGLPYTWFFDPHGFNYSSHSYNPNNWDLQITKDERESVQEYIINVLSSNDTLEKNGTRIGAHNFKTKYNILNKKFFLFLCKDQMILSYIIFRMKLGV